MKYEKENVEIQVLLNSINSFLLGSIDHKVKITPYSEKPRVKSSLHAENINAFLKN